MSEKIVILATPTRSAAVKVMKSSLCVKRAERSSVNVLKDLLKSKNALFIKLTCLGFEVFVFCLEAELSVEQLNINLIFMHKSVIAL